MMETNNYNQTFSNSQFFPKNQSQVNYQSNQGQYQNDYNQRSSQFFPMMNQSQINYQPNQSQYQQRMQNDDNPRSSQLSLSNSQFLKMNPRDISYLYVAPLMKDSFDDLINILKKIADIKEYFNAPEVGSIIFSFKSFLDSNQINKIMSEKSLNLDSKYPNLDFEFLNEAQKKDKMSQSQSSFRHGQPNQGIRKSENIYNETPNDDNDDFKNESQPIWRLFIDVFFNTD